MVICPSFMSISIGNAFHSPSLQLTRSLSSSSSVCPPWLLCFMFLKVVAEWRVLHVKFCLKFLQTKAAFVWYTCVPILKAHTKTFQYLVLQSESVGVADIHKSSHSSVDGSQYVKGLKLTLGCRGVIWKCVENRTQVKDWDKRGREFCFTCRLDENCKYFSSALNALVQPFIW